MKTVKFLLAFLLSAICLPLSAQQSSALNLMIEPVNIAGLPGLQSFACGQYNGKWLLIGGRLDGLHRRQPWASFDLEGHNTQLFVVDPINLQTWAANLSTLPQTIQEQLSSTNMEFYQTGNMLYLIGGYGYSATADDHVTYPYLTAVNVEQVIHAIVNNAPLAPHFRQITHSNFAVTGGRLEKLYNTYYLVGGQQFDGRYNPMNGPSFTQQYTNQIRRFTIADNGTTLDITHLTPFTDADNLHRRDYNLLPQVFPDGRPGITAFSGVFQQTQDLPYLNCVNIDTSGYAINNDFSQYLNHYHCATLAVYDSLHNQMHSLFFGGIAQYTIDNTGILVQDANVPFVPTIARITRNATGEMAEYKLPFEMPGLLGAGAEFIKSENLPEYANHVLKLHLLPTDTVLLGYIVGGIHSSAPNIFWSNEGTESTASAQILKVYRVPENATAVHTLNPQSVNGLQCQVFPNPSEGIFSITFENEKTCNLSLAVYGTDGAVLLEENFQKLKTGKHVLQYTMPENTRGMVILKLKCNGQTYTQKVLIEE